MDKKDIDKCVKLSEEYAIYKKKNLKTPRYKDYWASDDSTTHREKLSKRLKGISTKGHPKTYTIILTDIETGEKNTVYGNTALANFLGYKSHNASHDREFVKNITGTKIYKIEKYK